MTDSDPKHGDAQTGPSDEAKAKFREALERKKAGHHRNGEAGSASGPVQDADPVAASQRTFRRKSG